MDDPGGMRKQDYSQFCFDVRNVEARGVVYPVMCSHTRCLLWRTGEVGSGQVTETRSSWLSRLIDGISKSRGRVHKEKKGIGPEEVVFLMCNYLYAILHSKAFLVQVEQ